MKRLLCLLVIGLTLLRAGAASELVYVGSQGRQLHALRLDTDSGALAPLGVVAEGLRATWTLAHPTLPVLYAVDDDSAKPGSVTAFAVARSSGALTRMGQVDSGGNGTTHLAIDLVSQTLFASSFASGTTASIALAKDGNVTALASTVTATGSGPHRRQASAHAHASAVAPGGAYVLAPDLGADRVFVYGFDRATRALSFGSGEHAYVAAAGSGPRHLALGADGRYVYLVSELRAEITVLRWDEARAQLTPVQTVPVSSADFTGVKSASEIATSSDGRFLYVANRAESILQVYRIDAGSGQISLVQRAPSGGDGPWSFAIDPSRRWMLVANQRSATIAVLRIDPATGLLSAAGPALASPAPVNVSFIPTS